MGVTRKQNVPDRGDVMWLTLDPTSGHEQTGRRPVLVLSRRRYNALTSLMIICPITSKVKGYVFELRLDGRKIKGAVLADYVRSCDWLARNAQLIEKAPPEIVENTVRFINALINP